MANPISERPLRALIDDLANAIRAKDVNAVMTYYAGRPSFRSLASSAVQGSRGD